MIKSILKIAGALFISMALLTACGNQAADNSNSSSTKTEDAQKGYEYTAAYVCPMHCKGSGSENPGKCSVCGMDLVKNEQAGSSDHDHDHDHDH